LGRCSCQEAMSREFMRRSMELDDDDGEGEEEVCKIHCCFRTLQQRPLRFQRDFIAFK
jgi:hypothetical protein